MFHNVGSTIANRYQVRQVLGGGMGNVYACYDPISNSYIAIKTFRAEYVTHRDFIARFNDEAAVWLRLGMHQNIVQCLNVDTENSVPYLILELIQGVPGRGHNLRNWLAHGPLSFATSVSFAIDICRGLVHAASVEPGFVHCDLKPENVLVESGKRDMLPGPNALITDFGIVHLKGFSAAEAAAGTNTGSYNRTNFNAGPVGTAQYMAPEQWLDSGLDARTDLYALGCILFELLSGRPPFPASTPDRFRQLHLAAPPPRLDRTVPPALAAIIASCLEKAPDARPISAAELLDELECCYRDVVKRSPNPLIPFPPPTAANYSTRGASLTILGKHEEALANFDRALSMDNSLVFAHIDRGRLLNLMNRMEEARLAYDNALRLEPTSAAALSGKAYLIAEMGKLDDAISLLTRAISLQIEERQLAIFYFNRAVLCGQLNKRGNQVDDLRKAIALTPNISKFHEHLADWYLEEKDVSSALSEIETAIKLDPRNARAIQVRGSIRNELGQFASAREDFDRAARLDPDILPLPRMGAVKEPSPWQRRLDEIDGSTEPVASVEMLIEKGTLLGKSGHLNEALELFDQAVSLSPDNATAWFSRGRAYSGLRLFAKAEADYQKAVDLDPTYSMAWYNLGNIFLQTERFAEAIKRFDKALSLSPENAQAICNRGTCWLQLNNLAQAERDYRRAIEVSALIPQPHYQLGVVLFAQGREQDAIPHLKRALQLGSDQAALLLRQLGVAP
ncbi:MAG TPA: tetratricopeptide repeat protein [Bradyrhizobium sp.]|nr:tetratricopeptide repeat protein [Bradyrhizobium sp.]